MAAGWATKLGGSGSLGGTGTGCGLFSGIMSSLGWYKLVSHLALALTVSTTQSGLTMLISPLDRALLYSSPTGRVTMRCVTSPVKSFTTFPPCQVTMAHTLALSPSPMSPTHTTVPRSRRPSAGVKGVRGRRWPQRALATTQSWSTDGTSSMSVASLTSFISGSNPTMQWVLIPLRYAVFLAPPTSRAFCVFSSIVPVT